MNPTLLIILGLPRSFTSVIGTMLGQHPQMYGLPELHLLRYETVGEFLRGCSVASFPMGDGLRRAVAELVFGEQTEFNIDRADGWIRRRAHLTTTFLIENLAETVWPSILVDKSPSTIFALEFMRRALDSFPDARFLHLVRHPRGHGRSVRKYLGLRKMAGPVPTDHWLLQMAPKSDRTLAAGPVGDPQDAWYELNITICKFLESVATNHKLQVRGEDILSEPDTWIRNIMGWMQLRGDDDAVEHTKHPERSPYARFGPRNAMFGMDYLFLKDPILRPNRAEAHSLDGPLPWRTDGAGFAPYVIDLARQFGYR